jgi:MtrB/PioB family decaheme-associated outer membrane protein
MKTPHHDFSKGCSSRIERQAGAADRDGLQGAKRSHTRWYGEHLQRGRPPESADARGATIREKHPNTLVRAMQLALLAMFALPGLADAQNKAAQDDEAAHQAAADAAAADEGEGDVKELVCPVNFVELGAMGVSKSSPKFGEYTGLDRSGGYGIANFDLHGGDSHCQGTGLMRWKAWGKDLGTTSREIGASVATQGKWSFALVFDQLRHYTTTGYQTPLEGSPGSNVFGLAPGFGTVNTTAAAGAPTGTQALTPAQLASFRSRNVYNERQNTAFSAGYAFNTEWSVKFDFKRIDQSGAKLISAPTNAYNGGPGGYNYAAQGIFALMNPTKFKNDTFNFGLNWVGEKAYGSVEYYISLFHDSYTGVSFPNPMTTGAPTGTVVAGGLPTDTMSTAPSNQLHQLNLTGGYIFSPTTKLTGGLSFGINRQNASFDGSYTSTPNTAPGLPTPSLNGKVQTKHADARLTHQFTKALNLNVGFKYNERDNKTPVNVYNFWAINTTSGAGLTATNAPMSNKRTQWDAALDYRISKSQKLRFSYDYDHIQRWCSDAASNAQGAGNAAYYVTASCAQVPKSTENKLTASYKLSIFEAVDFQAGYTHADRKATVNPSFYNPMQANAQGYENYGFLAYFQASRRQDLVKLGVNWHVTSKLDLGLNGRYTKDNYYDSALGVQGGKSSSLDIYANYSPSGNFTYGAYLSVQNRSRDLTSASDRNLTAPPVNLWYDSLTDKSTTIGLNAKQKFHHDKLELTEDLAYGLSKSRYNTWLGPNIAPAVGNSGETPDIKSRLLQFRLTGSYNFSKSSRLTLGYLYQRLKSNDYFYNGYEYGFTPTALMPSNQQAPSYKVQAVYIVYRYSFQ